MHVGARWWRTDMKWDNTYRQDQNYSGHILYIWTFDKIISNALTLLCHFKEKDKSNSSF